MSRVFVCVTAAASDERDNSKAEEFAVSVSDDAVADVDSSAVVTGLPVVVAFNSTAVRLGTNAISDEVVISYEVTAWVLDIDESTKDVDDDEGFMRLGNMNVVEEFTVLVIDDADAKAVAFEDDVKLTDIGCTPTLSALMISAAFESN